MLEFTNHALPQFIPQKMIDFNQKSLKIEIGEF